MPGIDHPGVNTDALQHPRQEAIVARFAPYCVFAVVVPRIHIAVSVDLSILQ
jgi:hypothetical protein